MERQLTNEDKCCNRHCIKNHCARHWRNHDGEGATNLNPEDKFRCPKYLAIFKVKPQDRFR